MNLCQLPREEVHRRLSHDGLCLRTGPFVLSVRTPITHLAGALTTLYADFPVIDDCQFADFHIEVTHRGGVRRWVYPQAVFTVGGQFRYDPFRLGVAAAFFEWGLNGCVFRSAQHYLVVHGAVVERHGRAVVLVGPSGSGKSTLCAALTVAGWRLLSDELTLIVPDSSTVVPLARPISLKNDSIAVVRSIAPDASFGPAALTRRKGVIVHMRPPTESVERMDEPAQLSRFVFVHYKPDAPAGWQRMSPAVALTEIARQSFNYGTRGRQGFEHLAGLVDACPSGTLTYGSVRDAARVLTRDDVPVDH